MDYEKIVAFINAANRRMNKPEITVEEFKTKLSGDSPEAVTYRKHKETADWFFSRGELAAKYRKSKLVTSVNPFVRVYTFYLRDEKTDDDVRYNERFLEKIATPKGQAELFNREFKKMMELDPSCFFMTDEDQMLEFYKKDPAFCEFMIVSDSILPKIEEQGMELPAEARACFKRMKGLFESVNVIRDNIVAKGSHYYPFFSGLDQNGARELIMSVGRKDNSPEKAHIERFTQSFLEYTSDYNKEKAENGRKMIESGILPKDLRNYRAYENGKEIALFNAIDDGSGNIRFEHLPQAEKDALDTQLETPVKATLTEKETAEAEEPKAVINRPRPPKKVEPAPAPKKEEPVPVLKKEEPAVPEAVKELSQEEKAAALKWFESLKEILPASGFDLDRSEDSALLRYIDINVIDESRVITKTDFALVGHSGKYDQSELLKGQPPLSTLTQPNIEKLYTLAKQGKLVLLAKSCNSKDLCSLYIKTDGTAAKSAAIEMIPNLREDHGFPGAADPAALASVLTKYDYGSSIAEGIFGLLDEKTLAEKSIRSAWELDILQDYRNHPLYYANKEQADRRSEQILNRSMLSFGVSLEDRSAREVMIEKHNIAYEATIEEILQKAAAEQFPEDAAKISDTDSPELVHMQRMQLIDKFLRANLVGGPGKTYSHNPGDDPWDVLDEITADIINDKEVYLVKPDGKYYPIVMGPTDEVPKLKKEPAQVLGPAQKEQLIGVLEKYRREIADTTINDSPEFTRMQSCCSETIEKLRSDSTMNAKTALKDLRKAADDYYFAKVDQSQNDRRSRRFRTADDLRRLGDFPIVNGDEQLKYSIGAKAVKGFANLMKKSKEKAVADRGRKILENGRDFRDAVNNLIISERFIALCSGKDHDRLNRIFEQSAENLSKELFTKNDLRIENLEQGTAEEHKESLVLGKK